MRTGDIGHLLLDQRPQPLHLLLSFRRRQGAQPHTTTTTTTAAALHTCIPPHAGTAGLQAPRNLKGWQRRRLVRGREGAGGRRCAQSAHVLQL